ncbi:hypothetical protein F2Q69_00005937 [Brassica cretica]|uniref:DUF4283 domain-containing protein n=1 Tax=Brassica cretica TaxID=69181 RepID=A0A8S9P3W8_BRACR|nr:hypothetical protein F2Q69_00005937 [Brassica cretica]
MRAVKGVFRAPSSSMSISGAVLECYKVEVGVSFPWFPTRCNICSKWGHKGPECNTKQVVILSKSTENKTRENEIGENEKVEGELEGDNEVSLGLEKDAGKNGNSGSGIAFVGALLAELEDLPAPILQNEVGTAQSASNEEGVGKRAGKGIVTEEQPEWNDVPYRNRPSLDEPEVTKVSFDVASGTISPSRFKVLETLNEEEEGLDVLEEGEMREEEVDPKMRVSWNFRMECSSPKALARQVKEVVNLNGNQSARHET